MTTSVVVPLVSVGVGALVALLSTYLTTRIAKKSQAAALRAERKEAIVAFLDVAQGVEQAAEHLFLHGKLPDDTTSRTHQMWFRQKCIELVCTSVMNEKTLEYASRMHDGCYEKLPPNVPVWNFLAEKRLPFLANARQMLGIPEIGKLLVS